jgi:hypothetical protein
MNAPKHPAAESLEPTVESRREDELYFRRLGVPYTADGLLKVLNAKRPKTALPIACHSLADLNATEAIPVLKSLADFPIADVKATSVLAVARLAGRAETPWLIECLTRKGTDKSYVAWALAAVADPLAYDAVTKWFEPILRKLERSPTADPRGSAIYAVAYLEQVAPFIPGASALLERFRIVAPSLESTVRLQLAHATHMFSHWKVRNEGVDHA